MTGFEIRLVNELSRGICASIRGTYTTSLFNNENKYYLTIYDPRRPYLFVNKHNLKLITRDNTIIYEDDLYFYGDSLGNIANKIMKSIEKYEKEHKNDKV